MNALLVLALPVLLVLALRRRPLPMPPLVTLVVAFGVMRNLPLFTALGT